MKVAELIEKLKTFDPEMNVYYEDTEGTFPVEKVSLGISEYFWRPQEKHVVIE